MSKEMEGSIIRTPRNADRPYFSMCRATAQDTSISYEALGMLTYLLSKPDNWKIVIKDLHNRVKIGRDKCYTILNELREAKYIIRDDIRDEKKQFKKVVYRIYETPQIEPVTENPETDSPETENPDALHNIESTENRVTEKTLTAPTGAVSSHAETEGDAKGHVTVTKPSWFVSVIVTLLNWEHGPVDCEQYLTQLIADNPEMVKWDEQEVVKYITSILKPKKQRQPNPWYDAVVTVFDLHGGRNGLMVGLLQGKATKNGYKDYNLPEPLTSAEDVLKFGRWWKANHDGLTMVQSPVKVQSEVMGWQAKGCPDVNAPKPVDTTQPVSVFDLMSDPS